MLDVHQRGRAVVSSGTRERMELDVTTLHGYGLWATLQQQTMRVVRRRGQRAAALRPDRGRGPGRSCSTSSRARCTPSSSTTRSAQRLFPDGAARRPGRRGRVPRADRGRRCARRSSSGSAQCRAELPPRGAAGAARTPRRCRAGSPSLNDLRLALGTRLGVTEDDDGPSGPGRAGRRPPGRLPLAHRAAGPAGQRRDGLTALRRRRSVGSADRAEHRPGDLATRSSPTPGATTPTRRAASSPAPRAATADAVRADAQRGALADVLRVRLRRAARAVQGDGRRTTRSRWSSTTRTPPPRPTRRAPTSPTPASRTRTTSWSPPATRDDDGVPLVPDRRRRRHRGAGRGGRWRRVTVAASAARSHPGRCGLRLSLSALHQPDHPRTLRSTHPAWPSRSRSRPSCARYTGGAKSVEAKGDTLAALIDDLDANHPASRAG